MRLEQITHYSHNLDSSSVSRSLLMISKMYKNIDRFLGNSFLLEINPMPATTVGLLKFIICISSRRRPRGEAPLRWPPGVMGESREETSERILEPRVNRYLPHDSLPTVPFRPEASRFAAERVRR